MTSGSEHPRGLPAAPVRLVRPPSVAEGVGTLLVGPTVVALVDVALSSQLSFVSLRSALLSPSTRSSGISTGQSRERAPTWACSARASTAQACRCEVRPRAPFGQPTGSTIRCSRTRVEDSAHPSGRPGGDPPPICGDRAHRSGVHQSDARRHPRRRCGLGLARGSRSGLGPTDLPAPDQAPRLDARHLFEGTVRGIDEPTAPAPRPPRGIRQPGRSSIRARLRFTNGRIVNSAAHALVGRNPPEGVLVDGEPARVVHVADSGQRGLKRPPRRPHHRRWRPRDRQRPRWNHTSMNLSDRRSLQTTTGTARTVASGRDRAARHPSRSAFTVQRLG